MICLYMSFCYLFIKSDWVWAKIFCRLEDVKKHKIDQGHGVRQNQSASHNKLKTSIFRCDLTSCPRLNHVSNCQSKSWRINLGSPNHILDSQKIHQIQSEPSSPMSKHQASFVAMPKSQSHCSSVARVSVIQHQMQLHMSKFAQSRKNSIQASLMYILARLNPEVVPEQQSLKCRNWRGTTKL